MCISFLLCSVYLSFYRLMRPGQPHFVYGPENAITHGGHFYCSSLMQETAQSLIHTFVLSDFVSNTFHHESRQLLRRIITFWALALLTEDLVEPEGKSAGVVNGTRLTIFSDDEFPHLPDVKTLDGLLDLISGCTLAILGNVLDFRTYSAPNQLEHDETNKVQHYLWKKYDQNNIPGDERMAICFTRGLALRVFYWIREWCTVKTPNGDIIDDLPSKYMVGMLDALIVYKTKAVKQNYTGAPHCDLPKLNAQVYNVVECDKKVEKVWTERKASSSHSLRMTLPEGCVVEWSDEVPLSIGASGKLFSFKSLLYNSLFSVDRYRRDGLTAFDRKFLDGENMRCQFEVDPIPDL